MDCSLPGSSVRGISQQEYWSGCHLLLQGIWRSNSLALAGRFFAASYKDTEPLPPTRVPRPCSYMPCPFSEFRRYCLTAVTKWPSFCSHLISFPGCPESSRRIQSQGAVLTSWTPYCTPELPEACGCRVKVGRMTSLQVLAACCQQGGPEVALKSHKVGHENRLRDFPGSPVVKTAC